SLGARGALPAMVGSMTPVVVRMVAVGSERLLDQITEQHGGVMGDDARVSAQRMEVVEQRRQGIAHRLAGAATTARQGLVESVEVGCKRREVPGKLLHVAAELLEDSWQKQVGIAAAQFQEVCAELLVGTLVGGHVVGEPDGTVGKAGNLDVEL